MHGNSNKRLRLITPQEFVCISAGKLVIPDKWGYTHIENAKPYIMLLFMYRSSELASKDYYVRVCYSFSI